MGSQFSINLHFNCCFVYNTEVGKLPKSFSKSYSYRWQHGTQHNGSLIVLNVIYVECHADFRKLGVLSVVTLSVSEPYISIRLA